jgi:hypothetical protein
MEDYFNNLEKKIERDSSFTDEEVEVLKSIISVYRGVLGIKIVGAWAVAFLVTISTGFMAFSALLERLKN